MAVNVNETEAKYDAPAGAALPRLDELPQVTGTSRPDEDQLEAEYYDTDDLRLIRAGITLRRRCPKGPGGQPGNHSVSRAVGSHPAHRLFGQATPGPATTIRPGTTAGPTPIQPNRALQRRAAHSAAASKKPRPTP